MPDVEWGEKVVAAIVIQPGQVVSAVDLTAHCHARLSAHKRPKSFYVFSELPRSHYGKVQLAKVKAMIEAGTPLA
jgi:acyl-CoA synthetase (AMP-forming)/AMP-acid ligase II